MGKWIKLYLLLWKNFTLHRRNKLRLIVEIIWPLFLFLILMWVRSRGLRLYVPECHFDEKAMPSAGFLPFIQSTLCTFNNTCHQRVSSSVQKEVAVTTSILINNAISDIESVLKKYLTDEALSSFRRVSMDLGILSKAVKSITNPEAKVIGSLKLSQVMGNISEAHSALTLENTTLTPDVIQALLKGEININSVQQMFDRGEMDLSEHVCQGNRLQELLGIRSKSKWKKVKKQLCNLTPEQGAKLTWSFLKQTKPELLFEETSKIIDANINLRPSLEDWQKSFTVIENIMKELKTFPSMSFIWEKYDSWRASKNASVIENTSAQLLMLFVCGKNSSSAFDPENQGSVRRLEELKDQLELDLSKNDSHLYVYDNSSSQRCNDLFRALEMNQKTRFIWRQVKPFVRGKILYSPDTPSALKIMKQVNQTFDPIWRTKDFLSNWLNVWSPLIMSWMRNSTSVLSLAEKVVQLANFASAVQNSNLGDDTQLKGISHLLDSLTESQLPFWSDLVEQVSSVASKIENYLECIEADRFEGYSSEDQLVHRGLDLISENKLWAGVVFTNFTSDDENDTLPQYIQYKLRMDAKKVDSTKKIEDRISRPGPRRRPAIDLKYITFGFAYLQDMIEHAIIRLHSGKNIEIGMYLQQFPYPCYIFDQFVLAISRSFPMFMVLSWVYTCSMIIKGIVLEKERRLKEVMRTMGLDTGVLWLSWFIESVLVMAISCVLLVVILVYGKVLEHTSATVLYVYMMCYCVAVISQSFLLSTFFSQANIAAAAGGMIFFMLYLPYPFMTHWEERFSAKQKTAGSLLANVAFGFGCSYFAWYEEEGVGVQWSNMAVSPIPGDGFSLAYSMGMMLLDAFLYFIFALYIEAVFPGRYGVPRPWYFLVTRSYWCGTHIPVVNRKWSTHSWSKYSNAEDFDEEPKDVRLGVSVEHLTKVYSTNKKLAVDNLTLNFYEGQITSFLGHNGAGKTTTISILTGLFPPTSGTANIYGLDIRTDMHHIRDSMGVCPQYNVLFDDLTVMEHLWFYGMLKGGKRKDVLIESEQLIEDLGLENKRDQLSRNLSGGMQRKLSVGIAFTAGSKVVILDEPTAGVDPYARRSIWELLLKYKTGRTVILTTHHMDEADLLGDRIAVIANGKLRCCGSSLFLKSRYGKGYYLTIVKATRRFSEHNVLFNKPKERSSLTISSGKREEKVVLSSGSSVNADIMRQIKTFVQSHVPDAELVEDVGSEMSFLLPTSPEKHDTLLKLLEALEIHQKRLPIESYGISDTSLEEVFLRVTSEEKAEQIPGREQCARRESGLEEQEEVACCQRNSRLRKALISFRHQCQGMFKSQPQRKVTAINPDELDNLQVVNIPTMPSCKRLTGTKLLLGQLFALYIRRFHHTRRNFKGLLSEVVLPAVFVCVALVLTEFLPPFVEEPPIELIPWHYGEPNYVFFSNEKPGNETTERYINTLLQKPGLGNRCVRGNPVENYSCKNLPNQNISLLMPQYSAEESKRYIECSCQVGAQMCPLGAGGPSPPSLYTSSTDILLNMTGRNISDWIVKTNKQYYKKRYGGVIFGVDNPFANMWKELLENVTKVVEPWIASLNQTEINRFFKDVKEQLDDLQPVDNAKAWFNNKGWLSSVLYMNVINNVLLRSHLPFGTDPRDYGISVINHPMNFTQDQLEHILIERGGLGLLHAVCVIFAMSFVPASFVMVLIEDSASGSKHLQFVSGLRPFIYWIGAYTWDVFNYMIPAFLCVLIFVGFNEKAYVSENNIGGLILLMLMYGFASIPLMYPASYVFSTPSSAFVAMSSLNLFIGIVSTLSTFVLELFDDEALRNIASILRQVYLVFPHYCLGRGLMDMSTNQLVSDAFADFGVNMYRNPLTWSFLGRNLVSMAVQGIVFFLLTIFIEYCIYFRKRFQCSCFPEVAISDDNIHEDDDVKQEKLKVRGRTTKNEILRLHDITKIYEKRERPAVKKLCLSVGPGECFGLLGVNGAGKTTTFKMLTGNTNITSGNAFIGGHSIKMEPDKAWQLIGYCPQFDALDRLLTGEEHLQFYARLRGVPEKYVNQVSKWGIKKLGLTRYAGVWSETYSGGNKRKLSTAVALIGNPSLIFLDEPTTGMDPHSRRFLWNCIMDIVKEGQCVILTSHSMEECEALCTRLAIMVSGQFQCLGSIQHLKNKFGAGYTVTLKATEGHVDEAISFMNETFGYKAMLEEEHFNQMEYQLQASVSLSAIFRHLEYAREHLHILAYTVTQTTLEQVFVNFARQQSGSEEDTPAHTNLDKGHNVSAMKEQDRRASPDYMTLVNMNTLERESVV